VLQAAYGWVASDLWSPDYPLIWVAYPPEAELPWSLWDRKSALGGAAMSLQVVQVMLFTNRGYCPIGHSSSLLARFSANFRDFPNTAPPMGGNWIFQPARRASPLDAHTKIEG